MATPERPTSPFTTIYRWQITMTLSILHRVTGVILAFGAFGLAAWLLALSWSDGRLGGRQSVIPKLILDFWGSSLGLCLILGLIWCLIYHFLNGIRHLFWDVGKGFEIRQFTASGWAVVVLSFILTAGVLFMSISQGHRLP